MKCVMMSTLAASCNHVVNIFSALFAFGLLSLTVVNYKIFKKNIWKVLTCSFFLISHASGNESHINE